MFFGAFFRRSSQVNDQRRQVLLGQLRNASHGAIELQENVDSILASINPDAANLSVVTSPLASTTIVGHARLDSRAKLIQLLNITQEKQAQVTDEGLILKAYQTWGEQCLQYLSGDFSVVIFDAQQQKFFCARDQLGVSSFYYYLDETVFVFSDCLDLFHRINIVPFQPRLQFALNYVLSQSVDYKETAYKDIYKLEPAHYLTLTKSKVTKERYYSFNTEKRLNLTIDACVELYRDALFRAVNRRVDPNIGLGCELTGGIDSSSIAAVLSTSKKTTSAKMYGLSYILTSEELDHVNELSQSFSRFNHLASNQCFSAKLEDHKLAVKAVGQPAENIMSIWMMRFYRFLQGRGANILLSGFGGDEIVSSIHTQVIYRELIKRKKYIALYRSLKGNAVTKPLRMIKKIKDYKRHFGNNYHKGFYDMFVARSKHQVLKDALFLEYGLEEKLIERSRYNANYDDLNYYSVNSRLSPYVTSRLENCRAVAGAFDISYRWPLLDLDLIELFLSIPTEYKVVNGIGRYIHRKAVAHIVPEKVIWKNSKDLGDINMAEVVNDAIQDFNPHDLHDELFTFISSDKFFRQYAQIKQRKTLPKALYLQFHEAVEQIKQLDAWLKMYYPRGCAWA